MTLLITGGAGFIGSNFVLDWLVNRLERVVEALAAGDAIAVAGGTH